MTSTFVRYTRLLPSTAGWIKLLLIGIVLFAFIRGANCSTEPTESECRPYIEKALKEQHLEDIEIKKEPNQSLEETKDTYERFQKNSDGSLENNEDGDEDVNVENEEDHDTEKKIINEEVDDGEQESEIEESIKIESEAASVEKDNSIEDDENEDENENENENDDDDDDGGGGGNENKQNLGKSKEESEKDSEPEQKYHNKGIEASNNSETENLGNNEKAEDEIENEDDDDLEHPIEIEMQEIKLDDKNDDDDDDEDDDFNADINNNVDNNMEKDDSDRDSKEDTKIEKENITADENKLVKKESELKQENEEKAVEPEDIKMKPKIEATGENDLEDKTESEDHKIQESHKTGEPTENTKDNYLKPLENETNKRKIENFQPESIVKSEDTENIRDKYAESLVPEEELTQKVAIPQNLRPRDHINKILKLDERDSKLEKILEKTAELTLKSLKNLYDSAIRPLEMLYKYRDLSNRHFGDPEIFSKPLILFMGPWSGGKSSTINYLLNNEFSDTSLTTGAEPSPAYFNILMYGEKEEIIDGTQLAADWTFSGLQKFGQGLLDRLKGVKLPHKLLEKVNIVEIPGILEIRKQVQRLFPFNDACQWFIDRADIIFLVYDPSKLDVGPETEAILDQLKGRESQTRIILNKADQVKPEELMRVQGTLIWNISPLMSSSEPPVMYSTSLWSMPFETGAPIRLLLAQERAFLRDLREAIDKRVENKISSARRFAVRVRNHAKMVDCYLTTYYNHKSFFGNRKRISDDIIEHPQKYHIYEGLSTLTNISRYDLPDPDVYQDFFKINPLYEFKKLSETCTYFRGCPINKLDIVIAYDLPELIGKYKKTVETAKEQLQKENS